MPSLSKSWRKSPVKDPTNRGEGSLVVVVFIN
jgi:hypothetical protein